MVAAVTVWFASHVCSGNSFRVWLAMMIGRTLRARRASASRPSHDDSGIVTQVQCTDRADISAACGQDVFQRAVRQASLARLDQFGAHHIADLQSRNRKTPIAARATCRAIGRVACPCARPARRRSCPTLAWLKASWSRPRCACRRWSRSSITSRGNLSVHRRGGRAGAGRIFEAEGLRVTHRVHQFSVSSNSASVSPGKPTMKSPLSAISGRASRNRSSSLR